ncbi:MAG: hypothetical protein HOQ28_11045 [Thermoleophilia bacterium]|nr:hypothetical protein [Thermoleophilia bacterium]
MDSTVVIDAVRACVEQREVLGYSADDFPETSTYLRDEFERRVSARVAELADVERCEAEIEHRAAVLARELFEQRDWRVLSGPNVNGPLTTAPKTFSGDDDAEGTATRATAWTPVRNAEGVVTSHIRKL